MKDSKIEWTSHTFNPWRGCTKISPGCTNCYAKTLSHRNPLTLGVWGPRGSRVVAAESAWREPLKWNKAAACICNGPLGKSHMEAFTKCPQHAGHNSRPRAFCASLADVFEEWQDAMVNASGEQLAKSVIGLGWGRPAGPGEYIPLKMDDVRARLFALIGATPNLDWLLLTKRPENIERMMPAYFPGGYIAEAGSMNQEGPRPNVWLGVSVENQEQADARIPHLLRTPAAVRFLSCEPLLGPIEFSDVSRRSDAVSQLGKKALTGIDWVIVGGESGPGARPCDIEWIRSIVKQCQAAGVQVFVKQLGSNVIERPTYKSGNHKGITHHYDLHDRKGGDMAEWPEDLRVRQFPEVTA